MLEQEIASAIKFILENSGNPNPYYYSVPQDFLVPAAYFPQPEIISGGDTLLSYALTYTWFVKFFHKDTPSAFELGRAVLEALQRKKNLIPLIKDESEYIGHGFRMKDPSLRTVADGAVQLTLTWDSPRPYDAENGQKIAAFGWNIHAKN